MAAAIVVTLAVATAAVWPPSWWQATLLGLVPAGIAAVALDVPIVRSAGWLISILGPLVLLLVLPVVPWRRTWARWAVPASVGLVLVVIAAVTRGDAPVLFFLSFPAAMVVIGLARAVAQRRDARPMSPAHHTSHQE